MSETCIALRGTILIECGNMWLALSLCPRCYYYDDTLYLSHVVCKVSVNDDSVVSDIVHLYARGWFHIRASEVAGNKCHDML